MEYLLILIILIILLKLLTTKKSLTKIKGDIGEKRTRKVLLSLRDYKILDDILLESKNGTTQIDHICIGPKGVFVIEDKNYSGWIFGDENSRYWTQTIYKEKNKFFNPIRQNYGHIKATEEVIKSVGDIIPQSIIVFSDRCEFKKVNTVTPVLHRSDLKSFINAYNSEYNLDEEMIKRIYYKIFKANILDEEKRREHLERVKNIKSS
ncbi:nuclease-related domain protein [Clostridium baratii str. Sullivan]|uniref:Nuclease-related domain protein n=1 Tax=Clostridium baratii str. Sullivan TaxID=1415775 RepID=A0A0A7FVS3_9CLOT|nr:nuclease-related domain-containing protein [Clostridium baratii]AIY83719.1 nuclease-related domain protein [Clostridium baratii str. Sullivan]